MFSTSLLISIASAFLVTCALIAVLSPVAVHVGLVDRPSHRKLHEGAIPLIGGIAIFSAFLFSVLLIESSLFEFRALFAGGALLLIVGVLDDLHELNTMSRFGAQIVASLIMCLWGDVCVTDLGGLLGTESLPLGWLSLPFTILGTVGVINAINMIDGMDGLAGTIAAITYALLSWFAWQTGETGAASLLLLLASSTLAFLLFNLRLPGRQRARIFLGDAGSTLVGFTIAWFLIDLSQSPAQGFQPVTALWLLALPLIDTVATMLRRLFKGQSPFMPDHQHLHYVLLHSGLSVNRTLVLLVISSAVLTGIGMLTEFAGVPEWVRFGGFMLLSFSYLFAVHHYSRAFS